MVLFQFREFTSTPSSAAYLQVQGAIRLLQKMKMTPAEQGEKKKMNSDKMEISFENLEKVSGGTIEEARAYVEELAK